MMSIGKLVEVSVTNTGTSPQERVGIVFPARSTRTVEVSERRLGEIRACTTLTINTTATLDEPVDLVTDDDETFPDDTVEVPLTDRTVAELREIAHQHGLSASGNKADLIDRIADAT